MNKLQRVALISVAATSAAFALLLAVLPTPATRPGPGVDPGMGNSFVIDSVRVFDGNTLHDPTTLVVIDGKVAGFGDDVERPDALPTIDGAGQTVLPGLFDAHTHTWGAAQRDALRFGVTSMLDMFTSVKATADMASRRDSYDRTNQAALYSAGMLATVNGGHGTQFGVAVATLSTPGDAEPWVAARKAEGSDYIKLAYIPDNPRLPSLDLATASAIIDAAHAHGLKAVAHIGTMAAAKDLLDAGVDGFVHVFADTTAEQSLIDALRAADVFVIPTLAIIALADGRAPGKEVLVDPALAPFLNGAQKAGLAADFGGPVPGLDFDIALANVGRLHAAGVPILAGSDALNPGTAHGATLHQEIELLTRAGLSPAAALAAATSVPAAIFGATGRGVIAAGARADLVLVSGNPLANVRATRAITAVFRNGFAVARAAGGSGAASVRELPARLGDFDADVGAPDGFAWAATSDEMVDGTSSSELSWSDSGADDSGGAMRVEATVARTFAFPWAGAFLAVVPQGETASAAHFRAIEFDVRGTPARYRVMLFAADTVGEPPTSTFDAGADWARVSLPLAAFGAADLGQLAGIAIVTPTATGAYRFDIDSVRLVR